MDSRASLKSIRNLISQTPLIVDPDRDAKTFQAALSSIPTEKLQSFHRDLSGEGRRRFHYVANVCLGFESWSRLYQELVVQETQARLSDRLAEAYSHREEELHRREDDLLKERATLENEIMRLDGENISLRRENLHLSKELADAQQTCQNLQRQQQQLLDLVERYKHLLQELKRFMAADKANPVPGKGEKSQ
jgi:Skp family chaperone for outer membrane proteins